MHMFFHGLCIMHMYVDIQSVCCMLHKWKNHFFKMKGDIGMGWSSKKEGNKE